MITLNETAKPEPKVTVQRAAFVTKRYDVDPLWDNILYFDFPAFDLKEGESTSMTFNIVCKNGKLCKA